MHTALNAYLEALFIKTLREGLQKNGDDDVGEGKFGLVPPSLDPNSYLNQPISNSKQTGLGPLPHPLLSRSQQFSGIDRRLTADPIENEAAKELYPQLRQQPHLKPQKRKQPPRLVRS